MELLGTHKYGLIPHRIAETQDVWNKSAEAGVDDDVRLHSQAFNDVQDSLLIVFVAK